MKRDSLISARLYVQLLAVMFAAASAKADGVSLVAANPPLSNPYVGGTAPFRDVLRTGTSTAVTQGIGAAGTPDEGSVTYSTINVTFSGPITPTPSPANIAVLCTGGQCPSVTAVSGAVAGPYLIVLSGPIPPGECTTLTFAGTNAGEQVQYQYLPGDVNMDGTASTTDVLTLRQALSSGATADPVNLARYDIDRSGSVTTTDFVRLIRLLNGDQTTQPWIGATIAAPCIAVPADCDSEVSLTIFDGANALPLDETQEESPGALLLLNVDDDDLDGVEDRVQLGAIAADPTTPGSQAEGDLRKVALSAAGSAGLHYELVLTGDPNAAAVYADPHKGAAVPLPAVFADAAAVPSVLWLEGRGLSTSMGDIGLELRALAGAQVLCSDLVVATCIDVSAQMGDDFTSLQRAVCVPHGSANPQVTLDPIEVTDVTVNGDSSVTVEVSGTIADGFADIVADGQADITTVDISVNGALVATSNVTPVSVSPDSFHPFAFEAEFAASVTFDPEDGPNVLMIESAANLVGHRGAVTIVLDIGVAPVFSVPDIDEPLPEPGPDETTFMSVLFAGAPTPQSIDSFTLLSTEAPAQAYVETAPGSLVFVQSGNVELPETIQVLGGATFDALVAETLDVQFIMGGADVGRYPMLETSAESLEFKIEFTSVGTTVVGDPDLTHPDAPATESTAVTVNAIEVLPPTEDSSFGTFVLVADGPDAFLSQIGLVYFRGTTFTLQPLGAPPRWFFTASGQPVVFVETEAAPAEGLPNVHQNTGELIGPTVGGDEAEQLGVMLFQAADPPEGGTTASPNYGFRGASINGVLKGKGLKEGDVSFGNGITVTVGEGRKDTTVPVTLQIAADAASGSRDVTVGNLAAMKKKFVVYKVSVAEVNFFAAQNDFGMFHNTKDTNDLDPDYWRASDSGYWIEYRKTGDKSFNRPCAFVRDSVVKTGITFAVSPTPKDQAQQGITFDVKGVLDYAGIANGGTITWTLANAVAKQAVLVDLVNEQVADTQDKLPNKVAAIKKPIQWKVKGPGMENYADINATGDHVVYSLFAAPIAYAQVADQSANQWTYNNAEFNLLTPNRLAKTYSVLPAEGSDDPAAITAKLHEHMVLVGSDPPKNGLLFHPAANRRMTNDWVLWSTRNDPALNACKKYHGWCREQAQLLQRMLNLIGIKAQCLLVYASTDVNCLDSEQKEFMVGGKKAPFKLILDFNGLSDDEIKNSGANNAPKPNWNNYEGCLVVPVTQNNPSANDYRIKGKYFPSNFTWTIQGTEQLRGDFAVLKHLAENLDPKTKQRWVRRDDAWKYVKGDPTTPAIDLPAAP